MEQINLVFTTNQNNFKTCSPYLGGSMWYYETPMQYDVLRCGPMKPDVSRPTE